MKMENVIIQNVVMPVEDSLEQFYQLFYRAPRCVMTEDDALVIPRGVVMDMATYLNGVPVNRWREYTGLDNLILVIKVQGDCDLILTGYSLDPQFAIRKELGRQTVHAAEPIELRIPYPEALNVEFAAFEIHAQSDCTLYAAHYETTRELDTIREVNLVIGTTTCRKEAYIKHNVASLRKAIMEADDEMHEHFYINVVDNGNTLDPEDIESTHIRLMPNPNTGGSGGFARGMLEALYMERERITHVLLMDDDVMVLPESIRRTYQLLRLVRPEYQRAMVNGAMLELDHMKFKHEDIGTLLANKDFTHATIERDETFLEEVLRTNRPQYNVAHDYAGWWYCCIPLEVIKENGLPLPLFIRGDDVEYGIRCKVPFMNMTGIGIWHMGFGNKYSNATNMYQEFRNIMIVKDVTGNIDDVDIYARWKLEVERTLMTYNYKGAQALLAAMEDYLKGPSYIEEDHGVELLVRNKVFNEEFHPLQEMGRTEVLLERVYWDRPLSLIKAFIYVKTMNGQRWYHPRTTDVPGIMGYDIAHQAGQTAFHRVIHAVNIVDCTMTVREQNIPLFKEIYQQYKRMVKEYDARHESVRQAYHADYGKMTSEEFWLSYLGMDRNPEAFPGSYLLENQ